MGAVDKIADGMLRMGGVRSGMDYIFEGLAMSGVSADQIKELFGPSLDKRQMDQALKAHARIARGGKANANDPLVGTPSATATGSPPASVQNGKVSLKKGDIVLEPYMAKDGKTLLTPKDVPEIDGFGTDVAGEKAARDKFIKENGQPIVVDGKLYRQAADQREVGPGHIVVEKYTRDGKVLAEADFHKMENRQSFEKVNGEAVKVGGSMYRQVPAERLVATSVAPEAVMLKGKHLTLEQFSGLKKNDPKAYKELMAAGGPINVGEDGKMYRSVAAPLMAAPTGDGYATGDAEGKGDISGSSAALLGAGGAAIALSGNSALLSPVRAIGGIGAGITAVGGLLSGSIIGLGGAASVAQLAGQDGLAFQLRAQMHATVADTQDNSMLAMLNNSGIPIEDLLFYFLIFMTDKYEQRMRQKMEEALVAEKMQRKQEARKDEARMWGGLVSAGAGAVGLAGGLAGVMAGSIAGQTIGTMAEVGANAYNTWESNLNGGQKSSTLIANEVQVLQQKWRQLTELLSNMSKNIHDGSMTAIRNARM